MRRFFLSLFSSPESLLQVMSQQEIIEAVEDGDRIIIDRDGNASVNYKSNEVRRFSAPRQCVKEGVIWERRYLWC